MFRLVVLAILFVPLVASAEPEVPRFYARLGAGFGAFGPATNQGTAGLVVYDGALAVRFGEIWVRGALTHASLNDEDPLNSMLEWHGGVEWRPDPRRDAHWFLGLDAGYAKGQSIIEDGGMQWLSSPFVMPRAGYEFGTDHVRFQITFELLEGYGHYKKLEDTGNVNGDMHTQGANLELAIIGR